MKLAPIILRLAVGTLMATVSATISAQSVTPITLGQTVKGKANSNTDIYRFFGEPGMTVKATLSAPGKSGLILYTEAGDEMVTATGERSVTLDAILPKLGTYYFAVVRRGGVQPYSFKMDGVRPDPHLAVFASGVGYQYERTNSKQEKQTVTSCWLEPGRKLRRTFGNVVVENISIGRDGREFGTYKRLDGKTGGGEREFYVDGEKGIYRRIEPTGSNIIRDLNDLVSVVSGARYVSYLCDAP